MDSENHLVVDIVDEVKRENEPIVSSLHHRVHTNSNQTTSVSTAEDQNSSNGILCQRSLARYPRISDDGNSDTTVPIVAKNLNVKSKSLYQSFVSYCGSNFHMLFGSLIILLSFSLLVTSSMSVDFGFNPTSSTESCPIRMDKWAAVYGMSGFLCLISVVCVLAAFPFRDLYMEFRVPRTREDSTQNLRDASIPPSFYSPNFILSVIPRWMWPVVGFLAAIFIQLFIGTIFSLSVLDNYRCDSSSNPSDLIGVSWMFAVMNCIIAVFALRERYEQAKYLTVGGSSSNSISSVGLEQIALSMDGSHHVGGSAHVETVGRYMDPIAMEVASDNPFQSMENKDIPLSFVQQTSESSMSPTPQQSSSLLRTKSSQIFSSVTSALTIKKQLTNDSSHVTSTLTRQTRASSVTSVGSKHTENGRSKSAGLTRFASMTQVEDPNFVSTSVSKRLAFSKGSQWGTRVRAERNRLKAAAVGLFRKRERANTNDVDIFGARQSPWSPTQDDMSSSDRFRLFPLRQGSPLPHSESGSSGSNWAPFGSRSNLIASQYTVASSHSDQSNGISRQHSRRYSDSSVATYTCVQF